MVFFSNNHSSFFPFPFFKEEIIEVSLTSTTPDAKQSEMLKFESSILDLYELFKSRLEVTFKSYLKNSKDLSKIHYQLSGSNCPLYSSEASCYLDNATITLEISEGHESVIDEVRNSFVKCTAPQLIKKDLSLSGEEIRIQLPNGVVYFRVVTVDSKREKPKSNSQPLEIEDLEYEFISVSSFDPESILEMANAVKKKESTLMVTAQEHVLKESDQKKEVKNRNEPQLPTESKRQPKKKNKQEQPNSESKRVNPELKSPPVQTNERQPSPGSQAQQNTLTKCVPLKIPKEDSSSTKNKDTASKPVEHTRVKPKTDSQPLKTETVQCDLTNKISAVSQATLKVVDGVKGKKSPQGEKNQKGEQKKTVPEKKSQQKPSSSSKSKNQTDLKFLDGEISKKANRIKELQNELKHLAKTQPIQFAEAIVKQLDECLDSKNWEILVVDFFQLLQDANLVQKASPYLAYCIQNCQADPSTVQELFTLFMYLSPPSVKDIDARNKTVEEYKGGESHFTIARKLAWHLYSESGSKQNAELRCLFSHYFNLKFSGEVVFIKAEKFISQCKTMLKVLLEPQPLKHRPSNIASIYIAIHSVANMPDFILEDLGLESFFQDCLKAARPHLGACIQDTTLLTMLYRLIITVSFKNKDQKGRLLCLLHDELVGYLANNGGLLPTVALNLAYERLFTSMMYELERTNSYDEKKVEGWMKTLCKAKPQDSYLNICIVSYVALPTKSTTALANRFKIILDACLEHPEHILNVGHYSATLFGSCYYRHEVVLERLNLYPPNLQSHFQSVYDKIMEMEIVKNDSAVLNAYKKLEKLFNK